MNPLFAAALELQDFMEKRGWRFCFIGGLALARWGEPRATQDVDVSLFTGFGGEEPYVRELLLHFTPRVRDAAEFARDNRVVLFLASNGVPVDLALGAVPFEEEAVRRASAFEFAPGVSLVTCSAEDLLVLKSFAARDRDWADVEGLAARQAGRLDWDFIVDRLRPLCQAKETPDILDRLAEVRRKAESE
ncbi:MAG: nucleotidyl transferase AbiEii/AbiGii toxin family protein [Planctomycetes bacterium]|nr:nucleotidyl transferase AbiEii/AbiGii toxin family protein [Planctomycetota bacterium]